MKPENIMSLICFGMFLLLVTGLPLGAQTPVTDSRLLLWLDAGDMNADGVVDSFTDGSAAGNWQDKSGNGFTCTVSATPPVRKSNIVGGQPVVRLNGNAGYWSTTITTNALPPLSNTVFVVTSLQTLTNDDNLLYLGDYYDLTPNWYWWGFSYGKSASNLNFGSYYGNDRSLSTTQTLSAATFYLLTGTAAAATNQFFLNGYSQGISTVAVTPQINSAATLWIGKAQGPLAVNQWYHNGDIAEILIYKGVLSPGELNQVGRYLSDKYGLSTSYPNMPPTVDNANGATQVTPSSASLNGTLRIIGGVPATVFVYWGTTDGVTNASAWGHTNVFAGNPAIGALTTNVTGLSSNTPYFYRYCATNASGVSWAPSSSQFTPGVVWPLVSLVGQWAFDSTNDSTGNFGPLLLGRGAYINNGRLVVSATVLSNESYAYSGVYTGPTITQKTLVAWLYLDSLTNNAGSALSIQKPVPSPIYEVFDGIVYAERTTNQWMAGSEGWNRCPINNSGISETSDPNTLIQMAIVYKADNSITLYRNGTQYASYTQGTLPVYAAASNTFAIFGARCKNTGTNTYAGWMSAHIEEARIYATALAQADIQNLSPTPTTGGLDPSVTNSGTTNVAATSATLCGSLVSTGASPTTVSVFWGPADGGIAASAWSNQIPLGTCTVATLPAAYSANITGLVYGTTYYYTFYASNAHGIAWAPASQMFQTGTLVGQWTFEEGSVTDSTGFFAPLQLVNGAYISKGRLVVSAPSQSYAYSGLYSGPTFTQKTLVAWLYLDSLTNNAGSALSIQKPIGVPETFDGIVYAERTANQWMAGSDNWYRSLLNNSGISETSDPNTLIQMAIVYKADNSITLYRNGTQYASYTQGTLQQYAAASNTFAIFGARCKNTGLNTFAGWMSAHIEEARIYATALTQSQIQNLAPYYVSNRGTVYFIR